MPSGEEKKVSNSSAATQWNWDFNTGKAGERSPFYDA